MSADRPPSPDGVLVVDKPKGPTSHDVVARARGALRTREVGHAGTLDPMATGVLVLAIGEATKLVPYLTADDKRYVARIRLGTETDTLDAEGVVTETADVPPLSREVVEGALRAFIGEHDQEAPVVSAIKVGGEALHRKVRRGEIVTAPIRRVVLHSAEVLTVEPTEIELDVHCGKGFYVRSLARDLARALGTRGHLSALRRTASGAFHVAEALSLEVLTQRDDESRALVRSRLISLPDAVAGLQRVELCAAGVKKARHGKAIPISDALAVEPLTIGKPVALFGTGGELVAIAAAVDAETLRVVRGFREGRGEPTLAKVE